MKEKTKKFWAWFIGIFLICSGVTYFNQILVPALLVFIAGIAILPPINKKIKSKFVEKYSSANYGLIRNIIIIMSTIIFSLFSTTFGAVHGMTLNIAEAIPAASSR